MNISIDQHIKNQTPDFHVGVLVAQVKVDTRPSLDNLISEWEHKIAADHDISDVVTMPIIIDARNAYKTYGKDPSRYRLAVESLYRRIVKGNQLYRINNVVDLGNVLSLRTRKSVAVLDYNQIKGDVFIRLGTDQDDYYGIGRGSINITNIPLYEDQIGPFGSTTSDTERTKITKDTTKILLFIISFSGKDTLQEELDYAIKIYQDYASASIIDSWII